MILDRVPGCVIGVACCALFLLTSPVQAAASHLNLITVDGSINPASADYIVQAIARSEGENAEALLIELDTPGGLVSSSQDIIKAMLNSRVPIIVYVTPRGAWAASAGTFITIAANIAAMTPGSSIGAAHPVGIGGGGKRGAKGQGEGGDISMEKAENLLAAYIESIAKQRKRNVEWAVDAVRNSVAITADEALEVGVIDFVAPDRAALLKAIEGRVVEVAGATRTLHVAGARIEPLQMTILQRVFNFLSDPNVAVILMFAGLMGLYIEFHNPGLIAPGVVGVICLVLTGFAFQILPFSWVGLLLILVGIGLLVAEVFTPSFGLLFGSGIACFLLGGTMVFDTPDMSDLTVSFWSVLVPVVLGLGLFAGVVVFLLGRALWLGQTAGVDALIGARGMASGPMQRKGKVFIRGEYWNAVSEQPVSEGESVEVVAVEGLRLRVKPVGEDGEDTS